MRSNTVLLAALMSCAAAMLNMPLAGAAPATDDRGYVDSSARCADTAVAYGHTAGSRVAICEGPDDTLEYRGVRLRDGAKLVVPAKRSDDGAFVVENAGITYLVTAKSLVIAEGERVIREEPMVDFHQPGAPKAPPPTSTTPLPPPLPAEAGG
ncbi:hypothetical protein [Mycobacterium hubeiense]|uniref:hypothetical protein n=1 Tax=Mycobacterium hubeiense TaxID=1867256 RepID=UPI000C7F0D31|nr:hypothetical protein [Mycobacterium sp. QGD 101]